MTSDYSDSANYPRDKQEISVKDLILKIQGVKRYLLTKWITILIFGLIGGILGYLYMSTKSPSYISATTFVLEEGDSNSGGIGQYAGLASMVGVNVGGSGGGIFQGDNLLELYKSRSIISKTLLTEAIFDGKKQLIIERYIDINKLKKTWDKSPLLKEINFKQDKYGKYSRLQDSIISLIALDVNRNYLVVSKPDKKLGIINVKVTSPDEAFSLVFNNQIVRNVNDFYVQTKTKKSQYNLAILEGQRDSIRRELNGALSGAAVSLDANPNANPARQVLRVASQRRQFDAESNKAILTELVKNLEISKVSLRKETPLIQIIDSPVYPLLKEKPSKLKGLVIGGLISGILTVFYLLLKRLIKSILD